VGSRRMGCEMQEQLKEINELNNSLLKLAENLQDKFSNEKIKIDTLTADLYLLCFFFTKASKTASAVVMLCQEGYAEDACILVRTILEIVAKSLYIFKSDSIERARVFILHDKYERRKQLEKIVGWNRKNTIGNKELEEELERVKVECISLERDFKVSKNKIMWPNLEVLCKEVGLSDNYYTVYWLSSLYVHTLIRSSRSFVSKTDSGVSFYIGPDEKLSQDVLIWLFDLNRLIVREFDNRFNLGYKEKISEVDEKFNKFMLKLAMNEK